MSSQGRCDGFDCLLDVSQAGCGSKAGGEAGARPGPQEHAVLFPQGLGNDPDPCQGAWALAEPRRSSGPGPGDFDKFWRQSQVMGEEPDPSGRS